MALVIALATEMAEQNVIEIKGATTVLAHKVAKPQTGKKPGQNASDK